MQHTLYRFNTFSLSRVSNCVHCYIFTSVKTVVCILTMYYSVLCCFYNLLAGDRLIAKSISSSLVNIIVRGSEE